MGRQATVPCFETDFILDIMPLDEFTAFNHEENTDKCLEVEEKEVVRLTDEQARVIIKLCSGCNNATEFQPLPKAEQEKNIEEFKIEACQNDKSAG